jgi:hypothetical protein
LLWGKVRGLWSVYNVKVLPSSMQRKWRTARKAARSSLQRRNTCPAPSPASCYRMPVGAKHLSPTAAALPPCTFQMLLSPGCGRAGVGVREAGSSAQQLLNLLKSALHGGCLLQLPLLAALPL